MLQVPRHHPSFYCREDSCQSPPKFFRVLQQLHEGQQGQVKLSGKLSDPFSIGNGVKQGCPRPDTLCHLLQHDAEQLRKTCLMEYTSGFKQM